MTHLRVSTIENQTMSVRQTALGILPEDRVEKVIQAFQPISLQEMDSVALLNRVDTKFVLSVAQLCNVLDNLRFCYRILTINGQRSHHYSTLYFDTPDFHFYHSQVTGRSEIYKVRSREYLDTQLSYLEVKHKNQKRRTEKSRLPISCHNRYLDHQMEAFVNGFVPFVGNCLEPKLWNTFERITLVSQAHQERLTIDVNLSFSNEAQQLNLDEIAIAEIKQDQYSKSSPFISEMRRCGIRHTGFSKYCYGVSQLYSQVKKNSQKERALMIEKLQRGGQGYVCYA